MGKKIERVPYISKWYKEEQKDELLHFDFKDEPISVDWLNKDTTTVSCPNGIHFWSPQKPQFKLAEHWKELMDLFDIKSKYGIESLKEVDENCLIVFNKDWSSSNKLRSVFNKLGIDFIKDFIKTCEKCED